MVHFRSDNTGGYNTDDLAALNAAWEQIIGHGAQDESDSMEAKSLVDHWSERLLAAYDNGKRGAALVNAVVA